MGGDGDLNFICDIQASAAFPVLFSNENTKVIAQSGLLLLGKILVVGDVLVQIGKPVGRKWMVEDLGTASTLQPRKQHGVSIPSSAGRCRKGLLKGYATN